jgi:hypothetical protein
MAPPSSLPSAEKVANVCYDNYMLSTGVRLDPKLRNKLEPLAEHFAAQGTLIPIFIDKLVPWGDFIRPPNPGHSAIADFLICKAAEAALSANVDFLVEVRARQYGSDFGGSLDGDEATLCIAHSPLLKFHGCEVKDRRATIWAKSQLTSQPALPKILLKGGFCARFSGQLHPFMGNISTLHVRSRDYQRP